MLKNKEIIRSIIICLICIFLVFIISWWIKKVDTSNKPMASTYNDLVLNITFSDNTQKINIWLDIENNIFYYFLPSSDNEIELSFDNIADGDFVRINEQQYESGEKLDVEYFVTYDFEFYIQNQSQEIKKLVFMKSGNLPSLFIETESGTVDNIHADKNIKEKAEIVLLNNNGLCEYSNSIEYIKTRGNSTYAFYDKKPYQIKLYNEESLLDMQKSKKWILLANTVDDSLIRNELVFRYAEKYTSVPSSNGQFIDLYINGNYIGNYYLCEKIEINKEKLNINNLEEQNKQINTEYEYENAIPIKSEDGKIYAYSNLNNPTDITGGYIVERTEFLGEMPINSFITESGQTYVIVSPEKATMEQAKYICNLFNEFESAVIQEDGINPNTGKHFSEYLDVDSWASKYVIEEAFANPDSAFQSMFFYKDIDSNDTKIYCGPMWDYDRSLGGYGVNNFGVDDPEQLSKLGIYVDEMMQHKEVRDLVYDKFEQCVVPYIDYLLSADVYNLSNNIKASYYMDKTRWPECYGYYNVAEANYDYLIGFSQKRVAYLKDIWLENKDYHNVVFLDSNGNIYKKYSVKEGDFLGFEPTITSLSGIFNGWYSVDEGTIFDPKLPVYQDITYNANWIQIDLLLLNGLQLAQTDISELDPNTLRSLADMVEDMQQNANEE